jgi:peptidyl-prolyl cis-trans isomerase-like 2
MVKRQKEKQYQSAHENRQNAQTRAGSGTLQGGVVQRRLPFSCCALTQVPFEHPVCTEQNGIILESSALMDFILQYKKDPITGDELSSSGIITLHMDKDEEGRWQCPIVTKPFSDHTKIIAVLDRSNNEAYVYSFEAYKELNVNPKNYLDLTTGKKFNPKRDVVVLNDPLDEAFQARRDIQGFWYIRNGRTLQTKKTTTDVKHSVTATRIMEQIQKERAKNKRKEEAPVSLPDGKKVKIYSEDVTGVTYTSGKTAGSLTSSTMGIESNNEKREATQEEILEAQFKVMRKRKEKGYVRMTTNHGDMLLELHCDITPRTCTNFLGLCAAKEYDGTGFHRLIPGFMIQGGKAKAGEDASFWGPAFQDEFDDRLKHTGAGKLSMANAGAGTNKRQFFITLKSCPHLDRKHSIFGEVVDGEALLEKLQKIQTDKKDRPVETITILKMEILVDPAKEAELLEQTRIQELAEAREAEAEWKKAKALGKMKGPAKSTMYDDATMGSGGTTTDTIGKYLPASLVAATSDTQQLDKDNDGFPTLPAPIANTKVPPKTAKFGNFSGW